MNRFDRVSMSVWIAVGMMWAFNLITCIADGGDWLKDAMIVLCCIAIVTFYLRIDKMDDGMRVTMRISDESCGQMAREIAEELRRRS